jgi:glycosyltransferase involved in cell wall biosynthesis
MTQNTPFSAPETNIPISVVIPTYNRQALVKRAVDSVFDQDYAPAEVIVVDDGSADQTREVLQNFGGRIRYIYQDNAGCAVARDKGIRSASSDWVAFLDSDDFWTEGHLARMAAAIESTCGAANYYFADTIRPPDRGGGSRWQAVGYEMQEHVELREDGSDWVLILPQPMMLQSSVFRRASYLQCGGLLPQLRFREDTHLFLLLGLGQPVCAVAGFGAEMTSDDDPSQRLTLSYSNEKKEMGHRMQVWMFSDLLQKMPQLSQGTRAELQRRLAGAYRALARDAWHQRKPLKTSFRMAQSYIIRLRQGA